MTHYDSDSNNDMSGFRSVHLLMTKNNDFANETVDSCFFHVCLSMYFFFRNQLLVICLPVCPIHSLQYAFSLKAAIIFIFS